MDGKAKRHSFAARCRPAPGCRGSGRALPHAVKVPVPSAFSTVTLPLPSFTSGPEAKKTRTRRVGKIAVLRRQHLRGEVLHRHVRAQDSVPAS